MMAKLTSISLLFYTGIVNTNCLILGQLVPILLQKEILFWKLTKLLLSMYCAALCHKISKKLLESESWDIRFDNFAQNQINCSCLEGNLLGKMTNIILA